MRINPLVHGLNLQMCCCLHNTQLQAFLSATVLPQVTEGLVRIQREQPQDPILFLAQQLMQHSMDRNSQAEEKARVRFIELLHQGGF